MKGLELSRAYFEQYGKPMLEEQFPNLLPFLAAGLMGSGSECFGFDDEISRDHDFEPGFCLFLPGEDVVSRRDAFLLERAYAKLPKEFHSLKRSLMQPVGGSRRGVIRSGDFFESKTGSRDGILDSQAWLLLPDEALSEAVNGELFFDNYGQVTEIRERLRKMPEDVRKKKLAGHLLLMAQAGQYNYPRCLKHGETGAAQLGVFEFVKHTMAAVFLLNHAFRPYYKWSFRAMRMLEKLSIEAELLEYLITSDNENEAQREKSAVMEGIISDIIDELMEQKLTQAVCMDLEKHAYSVNDGIADGQLRNLHILAAV